MHVVKRWFVKWSRTLHVYITMLALLIMLFFSLSGFILNHEDWFGTKELRTETAQAQIPAEILKSGDKLQLVEHLREHAAVTGALREQRPTDTRPRPVKLLFVGPRLTTEVEIAPETATAQITRKYRGLAAIMAELHKGKSTGGAWRRIIDVMAISLFTACLTGFVLWVVQPKRRLLGIAGISLTVIACAAIWTWLVP